MPKKKKKNKKEKQKQKKDDEMIIGYTEEDDTPPKTKRELKKEKKERKKREKKKKKNKKKAKKGQGIREEENITYMPNMPKKKKKKKKKKTLSPKEQKRRNKLKNKAKKILKLLLKLLIIIIIAVGIIMFLFVSPVFNITEIKITGAKEISESAYQAMTGIDIGDNIFGIEKTKIIKTVKEEPYVESIEIKSVYPSKVEINIVEREICYLAEHNGKFYYLDKNGYVLEINLAPLDYLIVKGCKTNFEELEEGKRISGEDLERFNDLIKIRDAIQNNNVEAKLTSIDISDSTNYILEFADEKKTVMLGDTSDLSAKMTWINTCVTVRKNESGVIHLNTGDVFFSPSN